MEGKQWTADGRKIAEKTRQNHVAQTSQSGVPNLVNHMSCRTFCVFYLPFDKHLGNKYHFLGTELTIPATSSADSCRNLLIWNHTTIWK